VSACRNRIYGAEFSREEIDRTIRDGQLLSLEIEFNSSCNFKCIYCYTGDNNNSVRRDELTVEEQKDVIVQAREMGARKIIILGGEPMLYPNIIDMIRFIRDLELNVELFTNGANITPDTARMLHELGVIVVMKMNSFDEKIQDTLSGVSGAYQQIQNAFRNLKNAGYPNGCHMGISTVISGHNIDELPSMWQWLRDQNISPFFEMITPQGNANHNGGLHIDSARMKDFFTQIAKIDREKYGFSWTPQPPLVGGQCLRHQFSCLVNSRGYVQPCVGITIPVGNVREKALKDIIGESEIIRDLRNYRLKMKGPCSECSKLEECYGCRGAAYQTTGDYLMSDPLCWKNADKQDDITKLPCNALDLAPHRPPMLMIDRIVEVGERVSLCEVNVSEDVLFTDEEGNLDAASYPEIISQAIAAREGFRNLGDKTYQSEGFLVGIKNLEILGGARVGDTLRVAVYKSARYGEFGIVKGEVFRDNEIIARGEIKLWQKE
jgi:radical SAM protein with 4Fe4S-binding SPASM domain